MENRLIPGKDITASSSKYQMNPEYARLNTFYAKGGWAPSSSDVNQYLQVRFFLNIPPWGLQEIKTHASIKRSHKTLNNNYEKHNLLIT